MVKAYLIGFFCFIFFLILHVIIFRKFELKERFKTLLNIFFSLFPMYILLYILIPYDIVAVVPSEPVKPHLPLWLIEMLSNAVNFSSGLMLYVFLFLGYCQFYFIVDRSISVRVMIELENSTDKKLSFEEVKKIYNFNEILSRRLEHMMGSKYIVEDSGYYRNTPKGRFEANVFKFLKDFLNLGKGG